MSCAVLFAAWASAYSIQHVPRPRGRNLIHSIGNCGDDQEATDLTGQRRRGTDCVATKRDDETASELCKNLLLLTAPRHAASELLGHGYAATCIIDQASSGSDQQLVDCRGCLGRLGGDEWLRQSYPP